MNRLVPVLALMLALSGCGQKADLKPAPGKTLPAVPFGASERPDADRLLELPTQAKPERTIELRQRSEEREDDPFDLPPEE